MAMKGRFGRLLKSTVQALMTPADDPRATYADPIQQQRALLGELRAAEARLTVTKARLVTQRDRAADQARTLEQHARQALATGREDLARIALQRQWVIGAEAAQLNRQIAALEREESALVVCGQRLSAQIEALRSREQIAAARHSAAQAQVAAGEALTGLGAGADAARRIERIEDAAERLEARAGAIDEMLAAGLFGETAGVAAGALAVAEIEARLTRLKTELAAAPPTDA